MDLKHNEVSRQEAAKNLRVMIDGAPWTATRVAIVRRNDERAHWVHMIIMDPESGMQFEYFMDRLSMIKAWLALDMGAIKEKHIAGLIIELNGNNCTAIDVTAFDDGEDWIQMDITCSNGKKQIIAIERQGMIDAYYALRLGVEDFVETAFEVVDEFFKL